MVIIRAAAASGRRGAQAGRGRSGFPRVLLAAEFFLHYNKINKYGCVVLFFTELEMEVNDERRQIWQTGTDI